MRYVKVLFIRGAKGRIADVFLSDDKTVLHEDISDFLCRSMRPHNTHFEVREVERQRLVSKLGNEAEKLNTAFWYLMTMPHGNTRTFKTYTECFDDIFLCASGFYHPRALTPFGEIFTPEDLAKKGEYEEITDAACIFNCYFDEAPHYREVMILGERHSDCMETIFKRGFNYIKDDTKQGFWTTANRFLDRYAAKELALSTGQLKEDTQCAELYSEDLW